MKNEWQTIESAPKDGTFVLLAEGDTVREGSYVSGVTGSLKWGAWRCQAGDKMFPTHWQPLPPPPAAK